MIENCRKKLVALWAKPFRQGKRASLLGMTLIEIIFVVALLASLMALLVTNLSSTADNAKVDQAKIGMGNIYQVLQVYKIHNNRFPESLDDLVTEPSGSRNWRGPYIEKNKLKDPWGNEYAYSLEGGKPTLQCGGIDNELDTDDDIYYPEQEDENEG